jgi:hypothetical protein
MSNNGGSPQYDPFGRLLELASNQAVELTFALSRAAILNAYRKDSKLFERLLGFRNVRMIAFDDLTVFYNRIGVNTAKGIAFYCSYRGHAKEKADYEGFYTREPMTIDLIAAIYDGLLQRGTLVTLEGLKASQGSAT